MEDQIYVLTDAQNAASLLSWALQPKERPVNNEHYYDLLQRYLQQPAFSQLVESLARGLRLSILAADDYGMILEPTEGSAFALPALEYRSSGGADERILDGLIHIAIATTIYPHPQDLEANMNVAQAVIRVEEVDVQLRELYRGLEENARTHPDPTVEEVHARLRETWRLYQERAPVKQTNKGRRGTTSTTIMIQHAFEFLKKHGCFQQVSNGYRPTRRYQVHVQQWSATRYYQVIQAILEKKNISD